MVSPEILSLALFRGSARGCAGLLLAAVTALMLASCGGGSSGCGGGSGYQVDGIERPGMLMSCGGSPAGTPSMPAMTPVDPGNATALAGSVAMSLNSSTLFRYSAGLPTAATTGTLGLPATSTATGGTSSGYALSASGSGITVYCEIQGGGSVFYYPGVTTSGTSNTLHVTYPPFTIPGTFVVNCDGIGGTGNTPVTSMTVTATP